MSDQLLTKKNRPYVCGLDAAVDVIDGKWKVLILWALHDQPRRFGETKRLLPGISEKVLAQQLRELEADGVVHRRVYDEVPPKVEYSLTESGTALNAALGPLGAWGSRRMAELCLDHRTEHQIGHQPEQQAVPASMA
ncbi:winged helix-turn-helix transcriptional regulator [Streptomyces zagrosensis]|uniref:DNA-binding HxlR family transcriptional regulator n=1 Tax=Streptomyces zagrosensis TaxID=1042984 RepID=A0A7W9Q694_9ACTN|nr:helix-turn-helix domain-containing protein [Streptomyces zagrosensis]MBB5934399.1 DNA-binding HxlR family transcriptional regulator [Streptomyces zagrosensis]